MACEAFCEVLSDGVVVGPSLLAESVGARPVLLAVTLPGDCSEAALFSVVVDVSVTGVTCNAVPGAGVAC